MLARVAPSLRSCVPEVSLKAFGLLNLVELGAWRKDVVLVRCDFKAAYQRLRSLLEISNASVPRILI